MSTAPNNPNGTILVVDDEPDLVKILTAFLKAWKFDVESFTDPIEALETFKKNSSRFSLIITDLRMPGLTGFELAKDMLNIKAGIKIIVMTAYDIDTLELDVGLPMITYKEILKKPFKLKEICDSVKKQLQTTS